MRLSGSVFNKQHVNRTVRDTDSVTRIRGNLDPAPQDVRWASKHGEAGLEVEHGGSAEAMLSLVGTRRGFACHGSPVCES